MQQSHRPTITTPQDAVASSGIPKRLAALLTDSDKNIQLHSARCIASYAAASATDGGLILQQLQTPEVLKNLWSIIEDYAAHEAEIAQAQAEAAAASAAATQTGTGTPRNRAAIAPAAAAAASRKPGAPLKEQPVDDNLPVSDGLAPLHADCLVLLLTC